MNDNIESVYELSPLQQGILLHTLAAPHSATYFEQISWSVRGRFDTAAFTAAWQRVVDRHPALRTSFHSEGLDKPLQIVHREATLPVDEQDWRSIAEQDRESTLQAYLRADRRRGFDLTQAPLLRLGLARLSDDAWQVTLAFHHLLLDGWSVALVIRDVFVFYEAIVGGSEPELPAVRPFREYIAWLQRQDMSEAEAFWRDALGGLPGSTALPIQQRTPALPSQDEDYAACQAYLTPASTEAIQQFARRQRVTLNTVVQAAWALLLSRYSGERDVVFGAVTAGRPMDLDGASAMVGLFINTVPIRARIAPDEPVRAWLERVQDLLVRIRQHEHAPLVDIHGWSGIPRTQPLFTSILAFENYPANRSGAGANPDLQVGDLRIFEKTNFPLSAAVKPGERLSLRLLYDVRQFDASSISRMLAHFQRILEEIVADPARRVGDIPMLTADERRQVVNEWNQTDRVYPSRPVHEVFDEQARRSPDAVAVVFGERQLTYAELNRRANRLAHRLRGVGVRPGSLVGLCVERSEQLIVGLLGILKAGGAYVPLDAAYPAKRLEFMFADAALRVLVTQQTSLQRLRFVPPEVASVDLDDPTLHDERVDSPVSDVTPDDLAYITYTSGSTGIPKGVEVRHRGVLRLLFGVEYARFGPDIRILQLAPVAFDASTFEVWGALLHGGCCVVYPEGVPTAEELGAILARHRVNTLFITTALFNKVVDDRPEVFAPLRQLLTGGEAMSVGHVRKAYAVLDGTQIIHVYGPTETTTFATWYPIPRAIPEDQSTMPIGYPIGNTRAYVANGFTLQPVGLAGELLLGGDGLARGYLRRPELTAERFVSDPFGDRAGERLYRTGDLVRWLPDGAIDFLGRIDTQVKIRGFRVELGEIDAALGAHAGVRQCVTVVVEEGGEKRLVSYVVPAVGRDELSWDALRAFLRERLPEYMVPAMFIALDALPLNANGKIEKAALPAAVAERQVEEQYVAPRSDMERTIAALWREVLGLDAVGVRDNFFDLGGHSLLLVQLHGKIQEAIGRPLPLVELFEYPTVEALARRLRGAIEDVAEPAPAPAALPQLRRTHASEAIAVIGMAGRFPGAADIETFWTNLREGVESIRFFSDDEMRQAGVDERLLRDPRFVKARAVLDGADLFDSSFFGYNPREADLIDPQQRVFLECASDALEHAGYDPDRYDGLIGVYAGSNLNTYLLQVLAHPSVAASIGGLEALIANGPDFLPTRVSYKLNLRGPSVNIQTACSTSLVAVHQACRSLLDRDCDIALAGGVSVGVPFVRGSLYQEGGITSPDGHCRAFDADARGTVGGNGAGVVVLKRLSEALSDGDTIHGVILGTAINNDGSGKVGFTAPAVEGQAAVIARAQASAGVEPGTISYIEAHGTGTPLGDPIEVAALRRVFDGRAPESSCAMGSLKTNVGHLDAAAGVAGLIKTILAVRHRELPPSLHFVEPNPEIPFAGSPFYVNARLSPWRTEGAPRRAGVSSFGIGGTNAHAIVEEAPEPPPAEASRPWQLLVWSARTPSALAAMTARLADRLKGMTDGDLPDVAYTLQAGRRAFSHRRALVCRTPEEAVTALAEPTRAPAETGYAEAGERSIVFMFSGQGSQYAGMAAELYRDESSFRADVDACCDALVRAGAADLRPTLFPSHGAASDRDALKQTSVAQPALFVIEYALARLWRRLGVQPSALIGHSLGEYVAACLAGVFTVEDALRLVVARGRLMQSMPTGSMLAVPLPEADLMPLLNEGTSIAAVNGPSLCVASGPDDAIATLEEALAARSVAARRLETSHAFHSAMMDPALAAFEAEVARVPRKAPRIPFVSNVTGTWITAAEAVSPAYWARHLRAAVRFADGVRTLMTVGPQVLLEVGPGRTLATLVQQGQSVAGTLVCTSLRHPQEGTPDLVTLLRTVGRLWLAGVQIDWAGFYAGERRRRVPLPTYPFERQRHWIETRPAERVEAPPIEKADVRDWFYAPRWAPSDVPHSVQQRSQRWLVFADEAGVGDAVAAQRREAGDDVVIVRAGESFASDARGQYSIHPATREHYDALFRTLAAAGRLPDVIAHFFGVTAHTPAEAEASIQCQQRGFYSLLYLAQALGETSTAPVRIGVVTSDLYRIEGDERICPSKATVIGAVRVLPQEYEDVTCRAVDIVTSEWTGADSAATLASEIVSSAADRVVAYRRGQRWVPGVEPLVWDPADSDEGRSPARLRDRGVYLVTGGFGGIGMTLSEYLARTVRARLVLLGRTPLPPREEWAGYTAAHPESDPVTRRIQAVERLERAGAEVLIACADVSDADEVRAAIAEAHRRFGHVNGVIHAAGIAPGGVMQLKRAEIAAQVLAPKVMGTQALADALDGLALDFFLLCSSLASVLDGADQVDYRAANAYEDAFAWYHARRTGGFTVSINWDTWQDVGMAVETALPADLDRRRLERLRRGISPAEGVEVFRRVLARATQPQVLVSTLPLVADRPMPPAAKPAARDQRALARHARPQIQTAYEPPSDEIEERIAELWQDLLGIDRVGRHDNFFELGGHSLLATQFASRIRQRHEIEVTLPELFRAPTVAGLADVVLTKLLDEGAPAVDV